MNAALTTAGDWLIAPFLAMGTVGATLMVVAPQSLPAVIAGIAVGHVTDTAQAQASLCYRWRIADPAGQKRALRLQAFSATFGYSSGALLGGALYEHGGFLSCALLQLGILGALFAVTALLPVVRASFCERCGHGCDSHAMGGRAVQAAASSGAGICNSSMSEVTGKAAVETAPSDSNLRTIRNTNSACLLLPVTMIWLCDGMNIAAYICEWSLFAVYFADMFAWSSTLTGAAQMAGDLLAAAILALTTTRVWSWMLVSKVAGARTIERVLMQPPWNIVLFFALYCATFTMLAQPVFALSVIGQIIMGTICARPLQSNSFASPSLEAQRTSSRIQTSPCSLHTFTPLSTLRCS